MSGTIVGPALERRFEEVRGSEIDRLRRKLVGLSPEERESAEAIIADVIGALVRVPAAVLASAQHLPTLEAVVHLFGLDLSPGHPADIE